MTSLTNGILLSSDHRLSKYVFPLRIGRWNLLPFMMGFIEIIEE